MSEPKFRNFPLGAFGAVRLLAVSLLLSACGGGSSVADTPAATPEPITSTAGIFYPAAAGVSLVEYGANGISQQQSSTSDATGSFAFSSPVAGQQRVQSIPSGPDVRVPIVRSGLVRAIAASIEITPLTTLFDQLVSSGSSESAASDAIGQLVNGACGVDATAVSLDSGLFADTTFTDSSRPWLLHSLAAYLNAFRAIGVGASTPGIVWASQIEQRSDLLAQMCNTARIVYSDDWLASAKVTIAADLNVSDSQTLDSIASMRENAVDQVLALIGKRLTAMAYPELASAVPAPDPSFLGSEPALVVLLIEARIAVAASPIAGAAAVTADVPVADVRTVLDPSGSIGHALSGTAQGSDSQPPVLRFVNAGEADRQVRMVINGVALTGPDDLIAQVLAFPAAYDGEPLWQRAWRFVVRWRRHTEPITGGIFLHQPDMFIRSVGSGFCDDVSSVLYWIWKGLGYDAHVYGLNGHVVAEVSVNGRWEMYDADYAVYYFNRQGLVASVDEIAADPTLLTQPLQPILPLGNLAYDPGLAAIYSSTDDNFIASWLVQTNPAPLNNVFTVPRGGYMEILGATPYTMPGTDPGTSVNLAPIQVWYPPGYSGTVSLPMVLANVAGEGHVSLLGNDVDLTPDGIAPLILSYYAGTPSIAVTQVRIDSVGAGGLTITMTVNPLYFGSQSDMKVGLIGADLSGLSVTTAAPAQQ